MINDTLEKERSGESMNHRTSDRKIRDPDCMLGGQVLVSPVLPLLSIWSFVPWWVFVPLIGSYLTKTWSYRSLVFIKELDCFFSSLGKKLMSEIAGSKGRSIFRVLLFVHTHTHTHALFPVSPFKECTCYSSSHPFNKGCLFSQT